MARDVLRRCRFAPYLKGKGPTFSLVMWDTHRVETGIRAGRTIIGYELRMHNKRRTTVLFTGEDYSPGADQCDDSDAAVAGLMGFLTLRPGDTDEDYFVNYTETQLSFCTEHAETLSGTCHARFGEL